MGKKVSEKMMLRIDAMYMDGMTIMEIAAQLHMSKSTVQKILHKFGHYAKSLDEMTAEETEQIRIWLQDHWGWYVPPKVRKVERNGYRVVYVGDKSDFRTPYRPDGIWR